MSMIELSIVSPVYLAGTIVEELVLKISQSVSDITENYEIILVNDGSPDESWKKIVELCSRDKKVRGINLSRNFGQHAAIIAGLQHTKGNWVVVMDCDLQDNPEEIKRLLEKAKEGWDIVLAKRESRQHHFFKRLISFWFYKVLGYLTGTKQDSSIANFGIYSRKTIDAILQIKDHIKFFPAMVQWVGYQSTSIPVIHNARYSGESSYNLNKLFRLGLNVVLSFSNKPLYFVIRLGLVISAGAFMFALFNVIKYFMGEFEVMGYASLIVSIWFLSGIIITSIGMVGLYIGRVFDQTKQRPAFIVKETLNDAS